jgi:hypothetical protein
MIRMQIKKCKGITSNLNHYLENSKAKRQERISKRRKINKQNKMENQQIYPRIPIQYNTGMVDFPSHYIQYLKESYPERSYLGKPEYKCKRCDAIFWFNERNKSMTKHNKNEIIYTNCCKMGKSKYQNIKSHHHI